MTSSWFFLSTLNYDARSTTHQIYVVRNLPLPICIVSLYDPVRCLFLCYCFYIVPREFAVSLDLKNVWTMMSLQSHNSFCVLLGDAKICCNWVALSLRFLCILIIRVSGKTSIHNQRCERCCYLSVKPPDAGACIEIFERHDQRYCLLPDSNE